MIWISLHPWLYPRKGAQALRWQDEKLRQSGKSVLFLGAGRQGLPIPTPPSVKILKPWRDQACQTGNSCFKPASSGPKADCSLFPGHFTPGGQKAHLAGGLTRHLFIFYGFWGFEHSKGRSTPEVKDLGQRLWEHLFFELLAALGAVVFLAQGPPRHTARAIRIFRGIMIVEWKHICPQKSLIFPAVTNQLAGSGGSQRHQEPKLKRKKNAES